MKRPYETQLNEILRWINNTNQSLKSGLSFPVPVTQVKEVCASISEISTGISDEYPYYSNMIPNITKTLFVNNGYGVYSINPAAFGEVVIIIQHIEAEPVNLQWWGEVHPNIMAVSKDLFSDGYYFSAADAALKEVESRLREKFALLKPDAGIPAKAAEVIGALLSESGFYKFCDTTTESGKNFRRGIQLLFEGTMAAYRNPTAHTNLSLIKREAIEQIVLSSQLMYILNPL